MDLPEDFHQNKLTVDLMIAQKTLNEDIVKLKNFVARYKPNPYDYKKSIEAHRQYEKDLKEWDDLMRL
jgi:hypothetical protein